jgi:hypothetical protein
MGISLGLHMGMHLLLLLLHVLLLPQHAFGCGDVASTCLQLGQC